ncbi:MAG: DsbA family protein [Thermoleophilaceae bacterium]
MPVRLRYFTDPACPASWAAEPAVRRLIWEFGAEVPITYVMSGLARELDPPHEARILDWLDHADRSGMPVDPRLWREGPIRSTYPACMAVKAAAEQGADAAARYLRALREGLMCMRRKLDAPEALVEEARAAGLDLQRFRIDLGSHAIVEAFGADLDTTRAVPAERFAFPTFEFASETGSEWVFGEADYEVLSAAARTAGARSPCTPAPDVPAALGAFGRMATAEVEAVCDLPGPRAHAELWRLAAEWRVKPVRVLTGYLWEPA